MGKIMLNGKQYGVGGIEKAKDISYDNTQSGMSATNVQGALDELKSGLSNLIKTASYTKTVSQSVPAGTASVVDIPIGMTGYTPIAVAQLTGSGTGSFAFQDWYFTTTTNFRLYLRNLATSAVTLNSITVSILYIKN